MTRTLPLLLAAALLVASPAAAQTGGAMPDASQMSGIPLAAGELPAGEVSVRLVRERMGNNITGHPVTLKGGPADLTATTDGQGRAQFTGLAPGTTVVAEATVDGETLTSQSFTIPPAGGIRVALVAGANAAAARDQAAAAEAAAAPARQGIVEFGGESRIILEFQDDNLQVFYLLDVVNAARTPIETDGPLIVELPSGAASAGMLDGSSPLATVRGDHVVITGPFPPGTTQVQFGFAMPYGGANLTITQRFPVALASIFAAVEKVGEVHLTSAQFTAHQDASAGGTPFIMGTGGRLNAGDPLVLELTGLPHHSTTMRNVGLALAALLLLGGFWLAFTGAPARAGAADRLRARREKLYADLVELERQRARGRVEPARYEARRQALMAALERVLGELDGLAEPGQDQAA
ncbi:MAG: hypothetical protein AB7H88_01190 [Vicinamibacterales bacterium]